MKKLFYIISVVFLALTACQNEWEQQPEVKIDADYVAVSFAVEMPEFTVATRSVEDGTGSSLWLNTFDESGRFLETVKAVNGAAVIKKITRIIHFVNSDGSSCPINPGERASESSVLTSSTTSRIAWGRLALTDIPTGALGEIPLCRNFAKVTVQSDVTAFKFEGFTLAHYASNGTIAPVNESGAGSFDNAENVLTLPAEIQYIEVSESAIDKKEKYMFESNNSTSVTTSVIVKGNGRFYKVHLIDADKNPYKIERNYNYTIAIKTYNPTQATDAGYDNLEAALKAPPVNDFFAEVIKESPSISDGNGESLEILNKMVHLFTTNGTLNVNIKYTTAKGSAIKETLLSGDEFITGMRFNDNGNGTGTLTATIAAVTEASKMGEIRISLGQLSRTITVVSSMEYKFNIETPSFKYTTTDDKYTLNFSIPAAFPAALFPVECEIHTTCLAPLSPDKENMLVVQDGAKYHYIYKAELPPGDTGTSARTYSVTFSPSVGWGEERLTLANPYFANDYVTVTTGNKTPENPVLPEFAKDFTVKIMHNGDTLRLNSGVVRKTKSGLSPSTVKHKIALNTTYLTIEFSEMGTVAEALTYIYTIELYYYFGVKKTTLRKTVSYNDIKYAVEENGGILSGFEEVSSK